MIAIETKNLSKKFKEKTVVNSLNLSIKQGELFALLGVNGAGKTTTIKLLTCLIQPTSGDATLKGESIVSQPQKVKEIINVSPQETAVARNLSVKENLELIANIYGFDKQKTALKVEEMLRSFGLSEVSKDKAKTLSGGMQRRLSIAMALISEPQIVFLDEPTQGLDVISRRELWTAIEKLKGNVTIILTTHYMEEAEALSDRIGIMSKGELKATGTVSELLTQSNSKTLEEAFVLLATQKEGAQ